MQAYSMQHSTVPARHIWREMAVPRSLANGKVEIVRGEKLGLRCASLLIT